MDNQLTNPRRQFLRKTSALFLAGASLSSAGRSALAASPPKSPDNSTRSISLYNTHTGESVRGLVYWEKGDYVPEGMDTLAHLIRDHRQNQAHDMDCELFDALHAIQKKLDSRSVIHVVSGYRSPKTNDLLRSQNNGVARRSLHMDGKAIDIYLPDRELDDLRKAATQLKAGGVGYYPRSGFVHLDTGRVRYWRG